LKEVEALAPRSGSDGNNSRWLAVLAIVALVGAGLLVIAGVRTSGGDGAVLYADDVVGTVVPSTAPPVVTTGPPDTASAPEPDEAAPELDKAALELDEPPPEPDEPAPEPVGLQIDSIDVSRYPVRGVGLEDDGQLEIPDETEIGWYKYGATAGYPGATVLAAHVNWRGSIGPFAKLGTVEPGDQIEVALDDGATRNYVVTERTMYGKLMLPRERIWRNTGPEELVLITCGGEFNPEIRSFKSNIVVYAVPVG